MTMKRLMRDCSGGVLVEVTVLFVVIFVFLLGSVDFLLAFYQWNMANKAVQAGARIAAVSDPVAADLPTFTGLSGTVFPGDPLPPNSYSWTCSGATASCSGTSTNYNATAMSTIVYGRGSAACGDATNSYNAGMCDFFLRVRPANVVITYQDTGLGFAGRPNGPIPTITVALQNLSFQFFFLSGLAGFANINIPAETTTITGEDLSSSAPS